MDPFGYYSFDLTQLGWLRMRLQNERSFQTDPPQGIRRMSQLRFVRLMGDLSLNTGFSTRATLNLDRATMTYQLNNRQVTRLGIFMDIIRRWLENNDSVNLQTLVDLLFQVRLRDLSECVRMLYVDYGLPLRGNELRFNLGGELMYRIPEFLLQPNPPVQINEAVAKAVRNIPHVISAIFNYLPHQNQAIFREVGRDFRRGTLTDWRRNSTFHVHSHHQVDRTMCNCVQGQNEHSLTFARLLQLTATNEADFRTHPVRSLYVSYRRLRISDFQSEYTPLFSNPGEFEYMSRFGNNITRFSICCSNIGNWLDQTTQRNEHKLQWLVLNACPNLQYLELRHIANDLRILNKPVLQEPQQEQQHQQQQQEKESEPMPSTSSAAAAEDEKNKKKQPPDDENQINHDPPNENIVNRNLNRLNLNLWHTPDMVSLLLRLSPNLRVLQVDSPGDLEGIMENTAIGTQIQIEHLELFMGGNRYNFLNQYLVRFPATLTTLVFHNLDLANVRLAPFDEYGCIGKCVNLRKLAMTFHVPGNLDNHWYYDLSQFVFPNLEHFDINFSRNPHNHDANMLRMDFYTFQNCPALQTLIIKSKGWNAGQRQLADFQDDYFHMGPRDNYVPRNMNPRYPNIQIPLVHYEVRKFVFTCWGSTLEDLIRFFTWFPNLNQLHVKGGVETLAGLTEYSLRLTKVLLESTRRIPLRQFRPLFETNPELRVLVKVNNNDNSIYKVVVSGEIVKFEKAEVKEWAFN